MRALIIGVGGQVGLNLGRACGSQGVVVYGAARRPEPGGLRLDLEGPESEACAVFDAARPDVVFLCSAMTRVDACEDNPGLAEKINVRGTEIVCGECRRAGSKLVYLSTEYVFDGKRGPYSETDEPRPLSVYGRTKLEGERAALSLERALSVRTTVVYSYAPGGNNFLMQLIARSRQEQPGGVKMRIPADQYSNPTCAPDLAEFILKLVQKNKSGIYNVVGSERLDRYSFALKACGILELGLDFVEPALTRDLGQAALRPLCAGLKTDKLMSELGSVPAGASDSLALIKKELAGK